MAYERLDCYRLVAGVALWAAEQSIPAHRKHLRDQLCRAAGSVVVNIAEASGHEGPSRRHFYSRALGSAAEVVAAIGLLRVGGAAERQAEMRRVCRMLARLAGSQARGRARLRAGRRRCQPTSTVRNRDRSR